MNNLRLIEGYGSYRFGTQPYILGVNGGGYRADQGPTQVRFDNVRMINKRFLLRVL